MDEVEKRSLIELYLAAYNAFDIDGMIKLIHPNIEFKMYQVAKLMLSVQMRSNFVSWPKNRKRF